MTPDTNSKDLEAAQAKYLNKVAPGYRIQTASWSAGKTQIIEYGQGKPMLLVHGGMGEAFQFGPILPLLGNRFRVLAVDRPGHGMADPFHYKNLTLLSDATRFLKEIIQHLGLREVVLVGSSMGGLWTAAFALQYPELLSDLILVGAPAGITRQQPFFLRAGTLPGLKTLIRNMMLKPTVKSTLSFWKQMLVANAAQLDEEFLIALTASQARNARNWFTLIDASVNFRGFKNNLLLGNRWKHLSMPTTFIWGDKDVWAPPAMGEALVSGNANYRMIRIPDAGHAPWIDSPRLVAEAILSVV